MAKKIITVFGATGAQGGGLARAILNDRNSEFSVRAITRSPDSDKAKELAKMGAEIVRADIDDKQTLKEALAGAYGAYFVTFFWAHFSPEKEYAEAKDMAEAAKEEMARLTNENDELLKQARIERDAILREAKQVKDQIISEAKDAANAEGTRMIEQARMEINNQKALAIADVKNQVATLSIEIAEKILRKQFEDQHKQDQLVADLLKEVKLK